MPEVTSLEARDGEGIQWLGKVTFRGKGISGLCVPFETDHTAFSRDPATLFFIINFVVIVTSTALPEVVTSPGKSGWTEPHAPKVTSMVHSA
jgi:hypothetical protein